MSKTLNAERGADSQQRMVRHKRRIFQFISIVIGVPAFVMIGVSSSWWTATGVFLLFWAVNIDNYLVKK